MKEISKAEFNSHKIMRQETLAGRLAGRKVSEERQWFAHGKLLGVVLLDLIDNDWAFVVLSKQGRGYRTHDLGVSLPTQAAAVVALQTALEAIDAAVAALQTTIDKE